MTAQTPGVPDLPEVREARKALRCLPFAETAEHFNATCSAVEAAFAALSARDAEVGNCGAALIAAERRRQVEAEGWTSEHDDGHAAGELAQAAAVYATPPRLRRMRRGEWYEPPRDPGFYVEVPKGWPFETDAYKPSDDRIRELVKAGALIAAEIDRLQRQALAGGGGA